MCLKTAGLFAIFGLPSSQLIFSFTSAQGPFLSILYTQSISKRLSHHFVSQHMFADDTELYKSGSPSEAFTLARTIESCISDVNVWVVQNKLQLNDDKIEILLIGSAPGIDLPFD